MLSGLLTMSSAVADDEDLLTFKGTVIELASTADPSDENKMVEHPTDLPVPHDNVF